MLVLTKHHGLGNDFLVLLDARQPEGPVAPDEASALARRLCDRHRGVGADGLILGAAPDPGDDVDVVMHLFNADGSRAEMSGNGIRCLAQAVLLGAEPRTVRTLTDTGVRALEVRSGGGPDEVQVTVDLGPARPGPALDAGAAKIVGERPVATVDMGNPHVVVGVDDPDAVDVAAEGQAIERATDGGTNVEFVALDGNGGLRLRVWERGVGLTEACGTGACAAAAVAHRRGEVGLEVPVHMPGGSALVLVGDTVRLVGPSVFVASIEVPRG